MRWLHLLSMTLFLTCVDSTVKFTTASVFAVEHACPAFRHLLVVRRRMSAVTLLVISSVGAQKLLLHLATVALRRYALLASSTEAFMAWSRAKMLATWHELAANLATAPARVVVGIRAALRDLVLSAKADLRWTHVRAWRAGSGVASQLTRMRTHPRSLPAASLTTRMGRKSRYRFRIALLFTPTGIALRQNILR